MALEELSFENVNGRMDANMDGRTDRQMIDKKWSLELRWARKIKIKKILFATDIKSSTSRTISELMLDPFQYISGTLLKTNVLEIQHPRTVLEWMQQSFRTVLEQVFQEYHEHY